MRVTYWEIPPEGMINALKSDFRELLDWYVEIGREQPADIDKDLMKQMQMVSDPDDLLHQCDKKYLDKLIDVYAGEYCDFRPGRIKEIPETSWIHIRNYIRDADLIRKAVSAEVNELWQFILKGRSFVDPNQAYSADDHSHFCFLEESECVFLVDELLAKFHLEAFGLHSGISALVDAIRKKNEAGMLILVG
ncbi:MAG: hypothetical protein AAF206_21035 [Bacteroidota bacterium]